MRHLFKKILVLAPVFALSVSSYTFAEQADEDSLPSEYQIEVEKEQKKQYKLKSDQDKNWRINTYFGVEQERDHTDDWDLLRQSIITSPYVGAFIYQDGSPWMYDVQVLKTYKYDDSKYRRNRVQAGITRSIPFELSGKPATFKMRLGFRHDNYHFDSNLTKEQINSGDLYRTADKRNEIWFAPSLSYKYSDNLSLYANLSFRFIDQKFIYAPTNESKRNWGHVHEHLVGGTYKINDKNNISLQYLYVDEKFVNSIYNEEHFLLGTYSHSFNDSFTIKPYFRLPLDRGKQSIRNWDNEETAFRKKDRTRLGFQTVTSLNKQTSIFTDFYYRPERTWQNDKTSRNNFIFMAVELRHNF